MSWKKYKRNFKEQTPLEHQFIVGIDLGNKTSSVAYFDLNKKEPEIMDISGGYGKPSIPTVVQYSFESDDWIFGEYALLNSDTEHDIKIDRMIEKLGCNEIVHVNNRDVKISRILGLFIKELMNNFKNLDPKAVTAGIVVSIPDYFEPSRINEMLDSFKYIGLDMYVIEFVQNRECVLTRYFYDHEVNKAENVLLLDFGARCLQASVYKLKPNADKIIDIECIMSLSDQDIGDDEITLLVFDMFLKPLEENINKKYDEMTNIEKEQINSFVYQNKDLLFQKNIVSKPIKLYYNFTHPPFMHTFTHEEVESAVYDFEQRFKNFIINMLKKCPMNNLEMFSLGDIDRVICTGGGFEMQRSKNLIRQIFDNDAITFYKNSKSIASEGASIIAAQRLGVINKKLYTLHDFNILESDLGIKIFNNKMWGFYSLANRNSFWYYDFPPCIILINEQVNGEVPLEILTRNSSGETVVIDKILLSELPKRPKGTTKLKIKFSFENRDLLKIYIEDFGFGELFPKTDYAKQVNISIGNKLI